MSLLFLLTCAEPGPCEQALRRSEAALLACGIEVDLPRDFGQCTNRVRETLQCEASCHEQLDEDVPPDLRCDLLMGPVDTTIDIDWAHYMFRDCLGYCESCAEYNTCS